MTSASRTARQTTVWRRFRLSRIGLALGLVAFLVLGGTGAYAFWSISTSASMTTSVTTGTLAVTTSWSESTAWEFTNQPSSWTKMMHFTVSNTTLNNSAARSYDAVLSFSGATSGSNPVKSAIQLTIWKVVAPATDCGATPPITGTILKKWGDLPYTVSGTLGPPATTTQPSDKDTWCVYSAVDGSAVGDMRSTLATANGTVQLTPKVTATLKAGTWTGVSAGSGDGPVQKTSFVYPVFTTNPNTWYRMKVRSDPTLCMDVRGSGKVASLPSGNTDVIAYACHDVSSANQQVKFTPTDHGYVKTTFRHDPTPTNPVNSMGVVDNSTVVGSRLMTQVPVANSESQQWQLQQKSVGVYQVVNRKSGLCIAPDFAPVPPETTNVVKQVKCSGASAQEFILVPWENPKLTTQVCYDTGGTGNGRTFELRFAPVLEDNVTIQFQKTAGPTWDITDTTKGYGDSVSAAPTATIKSWGVGTYNYRIVGTLGTVISSGKVSVKNKGYWDNPWGSSYDYIRCGT